MFARKKMSENIAPVPPKNHAVDGPNKVLQNKIKRTGVGQTKRAALGDIANAENEKVNINDLKKKIPVAVKPKPASKTYTHTAPVVKIAPKPSAAAAAPAGAVKKKVVKNVEKAKDAPLPLPLRKTRATVNLNIEPERSQDVDINGIDIDTSLKDDSRVEEDISIIEVDNLLAFDREKFNDVFHVGIYAQDIFEYYKSREKFFNIPSYMIKGEHPISPAMRSILVDWMVEIQENFELNHETLYLAVKLTDIFLSRTTVTKDNLQLVGSVALFVASKFDEQRYPLIEDFTYVCDNAFDSQQFIEMEMELLKKVDFDLGIPLSYRFLRRYAKVGEISLETLTLARYILELSLMESEFISELDSKIAAAALFLAMKMKSEGKWEGDLVRGCGYTLSDFKAILISLNKMLTTPNSHQLSTIRQKYSHIVFHEVAKIPTLKTERLLL